MYRLDCNVLIIVIVKQEEIYKAILVLKVLFGYQFWIENGFVPVK